MIKRINKEFNMFPSHIGLRKYILYYNIMFPMSGFFTEKYTLMPDACGTLSIAFDGNRIKAELWGTSMSPMILGTEPNQYDILLLIQLSPVGLYQITHQSQSEFTDKRLSLDSIDDKLYLALVEAFEQSKEINELVDACEKALYKRMDEHIISDAVLIASDEIFKCHGQVQVSDIAKQVCYSERQLNRLFLTQVGMSTKNYARLTRFNFVLKNIQASPSFFATLSQKAGYFDQAHFDKDFKAISGVTPLEYVKTMSDFYYDGTEIYNKMSS